MGYYQQQKLQQIKRSHDQNSTKIFHKILLHNTKSIFNVDLLSRFFDQASMSSKALYNF